MRRRRVEVELELHAIASYKRILVLPVEHCDDDGAKRSIDIY